MTTTAVLVAAVVLFFYAWRSYWMHKAQPRVFTAELDATLYTMGTSAVAVRRGNDNANRSVICFPGFLEDMRYFIELYRDDNCQLILCNNAGYHIPLSGTGQEQAAWPQNPFAAGTIEHDGFFLAHVLRDLATGSEIVLHGHSRGGAVVLEAGRQFPQWVRPADRQVRCILEAAVLPGARAAGRGSEPLPFALICLLLPIFLGLSRRADTGRLLRQPMMRPTNALKTELCRSIYFLPIRYRTCITNVRSIRDWQRDTDPSVWDNYTRIDVVIGARDDVLDNPSMIASAEQGIGRNSGVSILHTQNTNHFISLEQPQYLQNLARG